MNETRSGWSGDLARTALQLLALGVLIVTSVWVLRPFLIAATWATMIAIATWPLLLRAQAALGGRRSFAVALLTGLLLLMLVIPMYLGIRSIVDNADELAGLSESLAGWSIPAPPDWLDRVPVAGARIATEWRELAAQGPQALAASLAPHASAVTLWFVRQLGGVGGLLVNFLLATAFTAILFARGESAANAVERFARRLAGEEGLKSARLAGQAIRAVALGVVVTALVQSSLIGLGLVVVGAPFAAVLTALCFVLAVAQIGPLPILIGVLIWAYSQLGAVWGTAFLIWAVPCAAIDNVLRPLLIRRGADLPLLLIFSGVIGGLIAFGVIGLFIGPVVLAVGYTLLLDWME